MSGRLHQGKLQLFTSHDCLGYHFVLWTASFYIPMAAYPGVKFFLRSSCESDDSGRMPSAVNEVRVTVEYTDMRFNV